MSNLGNLTGQQEARNQALLGGTKFLGDRITSEVLPLQIDIATTDVLGKTDNLALTALQIDAATVAVRSLASLAEIGELDHLGGGLELIPGLLMSLAVTDYDQVTYTIEHAHTSIGYFSALAAYGFVDADEVVTGFRRGLDFPGHVAWLPGGTQLNGGRLGVMVPVAVGQALGKKAHHDRAWVITHCGDAGWISGQALNGFNGAATQGAPITFVMHRNGIQLSSSTANLMDVDPRPIVSSLGVEILEIPSLHDNAALYGAYREGYRLAQAGKPSLIYPVGYSGEETTLSAFGERYGVMAELEAFAAKNDVPMDQVVWVPGSLMSYRDVEPMFECVFLVNDLPGGKNHHDGSMKGRDQATVLSGPMFQATEEQAAALDAIRQKGSRQVVTTARPAPGSENLVIPAEKLTDVSLAKDKASPRDGASVAYALVAESYPDQVFVVSCDLDPSTKLSAARAHLAANHQFEMSIEEQVATLMANGLAMSSHQPQLNVVSTFAAFFEGIAREGFDMWQYQRNLNGINEGLNVVFHLSHVGACTGRDHFSGWGLDWINVALTYLPYLHRFYAPCDTRSAFLAVKDMAAHYGGHIIGVPRDSDLPVLQKQDGSGPLWAPEDAWESVTTYRQTEGAKHAILALGAPAFMGGDAAEILNGKGIATDVYVVNGLPVSEGVLSDVIGKYDGVVTIEDGKIGTPETGLRGFAGLVGSAALVQGIAHAHVGITDPRIAPSVGMAETWAHFGITTEALVEAVETING
ncbi:MAG: transketolase N-terminal domain/subunit/transketolase C-terminal domain/subunit [Candidatus Latescibacterota bacterium]|jgi:transketolase N-terminal domain/subunit/transketolase C-terminal domain/subunit